MYVFFDSFDPHLQSTPALMYPLNRAITGSLQVQQPGTIHFFRVIPRFGPDRVLPVTLFTVLDYKC
jgi:hypothetical protein